MTPNQAARYVQWLEQAAVYFSNGEGYPFAGQAQMFNPEWLLQP